MPSNEHPHVRSTRLSERQVAELDALVRLSRTTTCVLMRDLLVPAVRARLAEIVGEESER